MLSIRFELNTILTTDKPATNVVIFDAVENHFNLNIKIDNIS